MNHNFNIPGMTSKRELIALSRIASLVPDYGHILEIGVYLGRTTHALYVGKNSNVNLTSIDSWKYLPNTHNGSPRIQGNMSLFEQCSKISKEKGSTKFGFEFCIGSEILKNINVICDDSNYYTFDKKYDFVFIDGGHEYETVNLDIKNHNNLETLIVGDDFLNAFPGVMRSCTENKNNKILIVPGGDSIKLWALVPTVGYWETKKTEIFKILNSMD